MKIEPRQDDPLFTLKVHLNPRPCNRDTERIVDLEGWVREVSLLDLPAPCPGLDIRLTGWKPLSVNPNSLLAASDEAGLAVLSRDLYALLQILKSLAELEVIFNLPWLEYRDSEGELKFRNVTFTEFDDWLNSFAQRAVYEYEVPA